MNMSNNYVKRILERINPFLEDIKHPLLIEEYLAFAMDDEIDYGDNGSEGIVSSLSIIHPKKLKDVIEPIVSKGPSWIHANLIPTTENYYLITLKFGAFIGNHNPSINVSCEPDKIVKVVN